MYTAFLIIITLLISSGNNVRIVVFGFLCKNIILFKLKFEFAIYQCYAEEVIENVIGTEIYNNLNQNAI